VSDLQRQQKAESLAACGQALQAGMKKPGDAGDDDCYGVASAGMNTCCICFDMTNTQY